MVNKYWQQLYVIIIMKNIILLWFFSTCNWEFWIMFVWVSKLQSNYIQFYQVKPYSENNL